MATPKPETSIEPACSGRCVGTGIGYQVVHALCPDPGNADTKERVRNTAKAKAYADSQANCKGENCECYGKYSALIPEQCVPVKDTDGNEICLYFAAYDYAGKCTILI